MQGLLKGFDALPRFFQIALVVFLLIPIWSTWSLGSPLALAKSGTMLDWAALVAYWVGPIALCVALFLRMHLVIFLFMTECAALLVHATIVGTSDGANAGFAIARAGLVACVAILGVAFLSRDVSMPFFAAKKRGFRGASRLRSNSSLRITGGQAKDRAAEMEDVSLVGMAFGIGLKDGETAAPLAKGDKVKVIVRLEKATHEVEGLIEWCVRDEMFYRGGFSTTNVTVMADVIKGVTLRTVPKYRASLAKLTTTSSLARAAIAMWIACFGGIAAVPACGSADFSGGSAKKSANGKKPGKTTRGPNEGKQDDDDSGSGGGKGGKGGNAATAGDIGDDGSPRTRSHGGNDGGGATGDQAAGGVDTNGDGADSMTVGTNDDTGMGSLGVGDASDNGMGSLNVGDASDTGMGSISIDDGAGSGSGMGSIVIEDGAGDGSESYYVKWTKLQLNPDGDASTNDDKLAVGEAACDGSDVAVMGGGQCFNGALSASYKSAASATSWRVTCNYNTTGATTNAAKAYGFAVCRKNLTTVVTQIAMPKADTTQPDPAHAFRVGTARCPDGTRLVGGGAQCLNGALSASYPVDVQSWTATCNYQTTNTSTNATQAYVFASCLSTTGGVPSLVTDPSDGLPSLSDTSPLFGASVGCDAMHQLVAGGVRCGGGAFSANTLEVLANTVPTSANASGKIAPMPGTGWKTVCNCATTTGSATCGESGEAWAVCRAR